ncbi:Ku-like DNA end binding [Mycobacterium phage Dylan]|uniref:Ku protein n=3 Tax=Viruses TaxID=10239 RepID=S5ZHC1_9CAUD|nr:Ku-like DNA end binding [Mycobacterium phage Dylan]AGT20717.1 Ku protein [Mycobacterium phage Dylan]AII28327.1 Ku-like protein [Mycobacterium phage YungJamal]ALA48928.1 Ku protein [Mycobacterium phage Zakhe101]
MRSVGNVDLTIGLVTVPVKMVGVSESHDRKASMYHPHEDGNFGKIKMPKLCEDCGEVVPTADIAKGFEEGGDIVILTADELASVAAATGAALEVPQFVKAEQINPMLFANENIYRLVPDPKRGRQAATTYLMVRHILVSQELVGVVQYTRWGRNRLGVLDVEPSDDGGVLVIRNMMWADELRSTEGIVPTNVTEDDIDPRLLPVMASVVESMTGDWDPTAYTDRYTEQLSEAITAKAQGDEIATVASESGKAIDDVSDLLAKLEASIQKKAPAKKATARRKKTA